MSKESYTDSYIRQQVRVENLKEGEARKMVKFLETVHDDYVSQLDSAVGGWTRSRLVAAIEEYRKLIDAIYEKTIVPNSLEDGYQAVDKSLLWNTKTLDNIAVGTPATQLSTEAVFTAANSEPFQGKLFQQWTKELARKDVAVVSNQLRVSWIEGEAISRAVKRITPGMKLSRNHLNTVVRSYFSHLATESRESVFAANEDIVIGKIWSSLLDARTTIETCAPRDQKKYDMNNNPIGHSWPWMQGPGRIHWNCRSTSLPEIDGIDPTYQRRAIGPGDEYEEGDNKTTTGKVRKPTRANLQNDKLEIQTVNTATDYEKWLSRQPVVFQNDVLGVDRAKAFRSGDWEFGTKFRPENPITVEDF